MLKEIIENLEMSSNDNVDEGLFTGIATSILGLASLATSSVLAPVAIPLSTAITTAGVIEMITSMKDGESEGMITKEIKQSIEDYKNRKFAKNMTKEQADKIIADVKKRKESLRGADRRAITRLETKLEFAIRNEDDAKIGKIFKQFIAEITK